MPRVYTTNKKKSRDLTQLLDVIACVPNHSPSQLPKIISIEFEVNNLQELQVYGPWDIVGSMISDSVASPWADPGLHCLFITVPMVQAQRKWGLVKTQSKCR